MRVSEGVWIIETRRLYEVASEYAPNRWWWKTERNTQRQTACEIRSVSNKLRSIQNSVRDWMSYKQEQWKREKRRALVCDSVRVHICAFSGILRYDQQQQQHIHNNSTLTDTHSRSSNDFIHFQREHWNTEREKRRNRNKSTKCKWK